MPKTPEGPSTDGTSVCPVVSPKTNADPEDFAFHHPELQQEVDAYSDLVEAAVEAAKAEDEGEESSSYRHEFVPYCG